MGAIACAWRISSTLKLDTPIHRTLPFFLQLSHSSPAFCKILRGPVDLIEIDHIDIQLTQTVFALATDGLRLQASVNVALVVPA